MNSAAAFYLRAAQSHLEAAQFRRDGEHFGVAIAESYHSILAAVKVRVLKRGNEPPERHSRSLSLLYHEFVEDGDLDRYVSRFVHQLQAHRDDWTYEADLPDAPEETTAKALEVASLLKRIVDPDEASRRGAV